MGSFVVDTYKVRVELSRRGQPATTVHTRVLEPQGGKEYHGITPRANLFFATDWDAWAGAPVAGFLSLINPYQPLLACWLPSGEYVLFYDLIRSEEPVTLFYEELHGNPYETNA